MKEVEVYFANGREVLGAYWGHLTGGGLAIDTAAVSEGLQEGRSVSLRIYVASEQRVAIAGMVVKMTPQKAIIAFAADDAKRRLLTAAFSDRQVSLDARIVANDPDDLTDTAAHLFRLSDAGCCLRLPPGEDYTILPVGTNLSIIVQDLRVNGCVVAARNEERWVLFDVDNGAVAGLQAYLDAAGAQSGAMGPAVAG